MKILILGLNYAPEKVGIAVYTTEMAESLVEMGHSVKVVAGRPYYPAWEPLDEGASFKYKTGNQNGVELIRCPHYIPENPSGMKRILHHLSFRVSSFFPMLKAALSWKPDVVMTVAPSLIAAPVALFASRVSGAKSWLHVQDFEVEAAIALGLLSKKTFAAKLARDFENGILGKFHKVSSISPQMCRKLREKGTAEEVIYQFRNWADTDAIKPLQRPSHFREKWNISTQHVALYSGNIANKQGISIVVDAARQLSSRDDLTFVVCGEGPNRKKLEKRAEGLNNVRFFDLQPKEDLEELMNLATVHLLPQLSDAADLVLPSKLTNMLASGRPVVATAEEGTGVATEVEGCGILVEPGNLDAFSAAIKECIVDDKNREKFGKMARQKAIKVWDKSQILGGLERAMRELIAPSANLDGEKPLQQDKSPHIG